MKMMIRKNPSTYSATSKLSIEDPTSMQKGSNHITCDTHVPPPSGELQTKQNQSQRHHLGQSEFARKSDWWQKSMKTSTKNLFEDNDPDPMEVQHMSIS
jgi:hypothetical protein